MAGRHVARAGGLRRVGDFIVEHPLPAGAVVTAALVAALAVAPLGTAELTPTPAHTLSPATGAAPVVALTVPSVIGVSEARAREALQARGFSMQARTESGEPATGRTDDVVIRQSPGAGSRAAKGATITVTVAPSGPGVSTPPPNAGGSTDPGTVSVPAGSSAAPAAGAGGGAGGAGNAGAAGGSSTAGSGGAAPAQPAPAPVPAPQPPAAPPAAPPVAPPPVVPAPTPLPSVPLPLSPLRVVGGVLRGVL